MREALRKSNAGQGTLFPQSDWYSLPITDHNAREKQRPPQSDWQIWLLLAGRGFGKTRSIVEWGIEQARTLPKSRGALVGATASDVYKVLVAGDSGILAKASDAFRPIYNSSKNLLTFPNGSTVWLFSAEEPNRLRGPQHHWAICDEIAAWQYPETFDQLLFGLRLGINPRVAIATTPRPTPLIKRLLADPTCVVVRGSTYENRPNLAPSFFSAIINRYEGTRIGKQEIDAEMLDDTPGALWTRALLEANRVTQMPPLIRIVIGLDPSASSGEDSDETGIIAVGLGEDGHGYVLEDATLIAEAENRSKAAVALYNKYSADAVVAEVNNGGDWIPAAIRVVDTTVRVKLVHASKGKHTRAEPIAGLYEQHRVHHLGYLGTLEDQLCSWTISSKDSPDRMDALVWALTELMLVNTEITHDSAPSVLSEYRG